MNQSILDKIKNQNYEKITDFITKSLLNITNNGEKGVVFGLSGGIDSAVIAYIVAKNFKNNSLALLLPDKETTPKEEFDDAMKITKELDINNKVIDINPIFREFKKNMNQHNFAEGNLKARIRSNIIYYHANELDFLVLGSSDKSEFNIGYFTKFGDGSADILPIISLYKTQIRELAKFLGIPKSIIAKKSSPNLWKNHFAEDEIGAMYEEIDLVLHCLLDKKMNMNEIIQTTELQESKINKILTLYKNSEHKRKQPIKIIEDN